MAIQTLARLYGNYADEERDFENAERFLSDLADVQRRVLGDKSGDTWRAVLALSNVYWANGKSDQAQGKVESAQRNYEKAEQLTRQALGFFDTLPAGSTGLHGGADAGFNIVRLAGILDSQGRYAEAEEQYARVVGFQRRVPGGDVMLSLETHSLGWAQLQQQKYAEAERTLREACNGLANPRNGFSESKHWYACQSGLGASLVGQKRYAEAEPLLLNRYDGLVRTLPERELPAYRSLSRPTLPETAAWLARMYEGWGKPQLAAEWRQRAETTR